MIKTKPGNKTKALFPGLFFYFATFNYIFIPPQQWIVWPVT